MLLSKCHSSSNPPNTALQLTRAAAQPQDRGDFASWFPLNRSRAIGAVRTMGKPLGFATFRMYSRKLF